MQCHLPIVLGFNHDFRSVDPQCSMGTHNAPHQVSGNAWFSYWCFSTFSQHVSRPQWAACSNSQTSGPIGVARGCSGCTCTPQGGEKIFFRPNLQQKCVSAPPQDTKCTPSQSKSQFLGVFAEWLRFGGIFRRRRLKKVVNFFAKKVHPHTQNPGYAYEWTKHRTIISAPRVCFKTCFGRFWSKTEPYFIL